MQKAVKYNKRLNNKYCYLQLNQLDKIAFPIARIWLLQHNHVQYIHRLCYYFSYDYCVSSLFSSIVTVSRPFLSQCDGFLVGPSYGARQVNPDLSQQAVLGMLHPR